MRLTDIRCAAARKGYRFGNCAICSVFDRSSLSAQWLAVTFRRRPFRRPAVPDGPHGGFTIGWNCLVHSRGGSNYRAGQFCGLAASDAAYCRAPSASTATGASSAWTAQRQSALERSTGPSSDAATPAGFIGSPRRPTTTGAPAGNSTAPLRRPLRVPDFEALAHRYETALDDARLQAFAESLGLSAGSLRRLRVGWAENHAAWSFPMVDAHGLVRGIRLRTLSGHKFAVAGGHDGLFMPRDLTLAPGGHS